MKSTIIDFQGYSDVDCGSLDLLEQPAPPSKRMRLAAPKIHSIVAAKMPKLGEIPEVKIEDLPRLAEIAGCTVSQIEQMVRATDPRRPVPAGRIEQYPMEGEKPWGWATAHVNAEGEEVAFLVAAESREGDWLVWGFSMDDRNRVRTALEAGPKHWQAFVDGSEPVVVCRTRTAHEVKESLAKRVSAATFAYQCLIAQAVYAAKTASRLLVEANQLLTVATLGKPSVAGTVELIDAVYAEVQAPSE